MTLFNSLLRLLAALTLCHATAAYPGPMGFKGSAMTMGDFSPNWQEGWINYAMTSRDAVGVGALRMRSDDRRLTRQLSEVTYTRLVKRVNGEHSQANLWFLGGVGPVSGNDFAGTKTLWAPGISGDYETTRVYVSGTLRLYRANGMNHDFASARAGFSFYEVDYEETQPWFILEARRMRGLSEGIEITPMLRLINKRYFVDLGVSNASQARMNFMYIF
jgi:hypothetical protein